MGSALAQQPLVPGGVIDNGKYRIIRQLGAGGMGTVYEAENTLTRKRVAIKCMHAGRTGSAESSARLLREAEAASRIRHPHVVDVYDVGHDGEGVFLVMEYLEGEPLSQLLARGGASVHSLIALLLPALRGVAEAHRQGVVHRDIKPDNIFLAREADAKQPVPKVLDFGISKLSTQADERTPLTLSGSTLGTPRYMPYEQLMGDKTIDGRVDVYAFGVILYEALTGQAPFDADTYPELILKIANGVLTPPKQLRPELPHTLDRLVCWALARDREQRIPSIEQLIRELEPFATERGLLAELEIAEPASPQLAAPAPSSKIVSKPRAKRFAKGWLALGLGVATGVGLWLETRSSSEPSQTEAAAAVPLPPLAAIQPATAGAPQPLDVAGRAAQRELPETTSAQSAPPAIAVPDEPAGAGLSAPQRPAANRDKRRSTKLAAAPASPSGIAPEPTPPPPPVAEPTRPVPASFRVKLPQSEEF